MPEKVNQTSTIQYLWSSLRLEQRISLLGIILAATISGTAYYYWGVRNPEYFYYSVFSSTVVAILTDRLSRFHLENKHMADLLAFSPVKKDLHCIGDSKDGVAWFCDNYAGLQAVHNTVYRPLGILTPGYERYFKSIARAISDGCIWRDLVCPHLNKEPVSLETFYDMLTTDDQRSRYEAKKLVDVDIPLFQTTIYEYRDKAPVVSFGWGFPGGDKTRVFMSDDPDTVAFFKRYFERLYESDKAQFLYKPVYSPPPMEKPKTSWFSRWRPRDRSP